MTTIYTATKGVVERHKLVNPTKKGYRVISGSRGYETVVFTLKQYTGWVEHQEKPYYQQRAFTSRKAADRFAARQLLCMKKHYQEKLNRILELEEQLASKGK